MRLTDIQVHPQLAAHKTGNYLPYRLAMGRAGDAFEGWLVGPEGTLADGSRTSPLLELGGNGSSRRVDCRALRGRHFWRAVTGQSVRFTLRNCIT